MKMNFLQQFLITIPIYNMEGEIKIQGSYKGLYVLSSTERSIQVKVHEITSEYLLHSSS